MSLLNRFTNILQNAVEALAPQASSLEEFSFHWRRITNYYIESTDEKEPVIRTNIPAHLQQMLQILVLEEQDMIAEFGNASNQTGPCMEFLLHQNILETLTTFGRGDTPPGMKQQVLAFATKLLGKIKQPLLPHVNVHKPVIKLVSICGEVMAAPTEKEEVHFLCVVCSKIKIDPYQVNFFISNISNFPNVKRKSPTSIDQIAEELDDLSVESDATGAIDLSNIDIDIDDSHHLDIYHTKREEFQLAESLLNLTKSPDQRIAVKACEGLMLLVGVPEARSARTLVECTAFAQIICSKLAKLVSDLPLNVDPADVESTEAKWGLDQYSAKEDKQGFAGKRQLRSFLSFLDFIDTLMEESHKIIGLSISRALRVHVFETRLKKVLMATNENTSLSITAIATKMISECKSSHLITQIAVFMLGDGTENPEQPDVKENETRDVLISRCDHISDELSITTLRLFEVLLHKTDKVVIENLISRNLTPRRYVKTKAEIEAEVVENDASASIETDEPEFEWDDTDVLAPAKTDQKNTPTITPEELADPKKRLEHSVNLFLSVVPEALRSSYEQEELGHEQYLRDAHTAFRDAMKKTKRFNWPTQVKSPETSEDEEVPPFYPGAFIGMLLNKLGRVLDQSYDINLQVTSVVSRFCLVPHVFLTEFALDPLLDCRKDAKTLYTTLLDVVKVLESRAARIPQFRDKLVSTRKRLIGMDQDMENPEHRTLLEGVIVLEEFCKEVAAIAFVKHHAALNGFENFT